MTTASGSGRLLQFEQTLKSRVDKLGPEHPDTLFTQQNLAMAYREAASRDRAIPLFEQTLASQITPTRRRPPVHAPDPEQSWTGLSGGW